MRVVFRVDASIHIGSGHVMRCLVLAQELKHIGYDVLFATRAQKADLNTLISRRGFELIALQKPYEWSIPNHSSDYAAWLQVSEEQDSLDFINRVKYADLVIVDHYGIGIIWHETIKSKLNCILTVIDDLVREHRAHIIVDQTLNRQPSNYEKTFPCKALTGTEYALLNPEFIKQRQLQHSNPNAHNILLTMGGVDKPNATLKVLQTLATVQQPRPTTVLLSQRAPNYPAIKEFAKNHSTWVKHIEFVDNMAIFMGQFSLVIGAPGSTSWERACLGIPSILVPIADNQNDIANALVNAGAIKIINIEDIGNQLLASIDHLVTHWQYYSNLNFALCDGMGVKRVTQTIKEALQTC
ncbi:UDP-2,4-diacetamido-2,4,6-trideoxy-beta-L-altropyranose hydrolase [Pseudoalteromonas sp. NZS100]|uniref:UDP-2,4-diacetamido-2,4, 6-trideoxy-beta-L-altropyranose hydrolase n=1 Tax=Pseudoalteromonas sp. NZS100 TaxID=2792046 RepID=UPI0018CEC35A|nr:UDP-2,4-diacetamido-2,4,6-trideoxy-beta-L-altropyranose hydrolase [Pseudoalteromonas sp. NZS100]MBH0067368.1 UDP-2,4-diacetamido-2,4,6-trideoxy-beta-L-altropyranose hydrolase [Pseudoalteromonas sp. NZS100]